MPWKYACPSPVCDESFDVHPDAEAHVAEAHPDDRLVVGHGVFTSQQDAQRERWGATR